jgi:Mn-dependent DtxR family transcriptional regulator
MNRASYYLARLRVNGLITRIPRKDRYRLTGDGLRFAIFYTKLHDRLLRPARSSSTTNATAGTKRLAHHRDSHHRNHRPGSPPAKAA